MKTKKIEEDKIMEPVSMKDISNQSNKPPSLLNRLFTIFLMVGIGVGGFCGGLYYATKSFDNYAGELLVEFKNISNDIDAFRKVSDPSTVRHYIKELNLILDDINFLDQVIQSGQVADETLDKFLSDYQDKLDDVNSKMVELSIELQGTVSEIAESVTNDINNSHMAIEGLVIKNSNDVKKEVKKEIGDMYDKIDSLHNDLEKLTSILEGAKNTFFGKQVFKK
jgi:AraC-like DNA-binding protein